MWIKALLESMKAFVMVNGSPIKEFTFSRGLRQGDPLYPLLLNIVGEVSGTLMSEAKNKELIRAYLLAMKVSHIYNLQMIILLFS